ncbi:hypothetical protein CK203_064883 [Vitis vinifera]|uniref:Uncharacterized protein n=1 Tax=Vitis vinifera TaxID=29760 RepID=A0A438G499_VITVI|nr:hypothetical protein CK203_064883 [Vitis vinifera]
MIEEAFDPNRTVFSIEWFDFLGSIFVLKSVVIPTLQWILPDHCSQLGFQEPCPFGGVMVLPIVCIQSYSEQHLKKETATMMDLLSSL